MSAGATLRQARTERRVALGDVAQATKIQPWVLEALEGDRLQELMSPIYVKGFVASYAQFLHLAPEPLIAQLAWPPTVPQATLPPATLDRRWRLRLPMVAPRRLATVAVVAAAAALVTIVRPLSWFSKVSWPAIRLPQIASLSVGREMPPAPPPALSIAPTQPLQLTLTARRGTWVRVRSDGKLLAQQRLPRGAQERWSAARQLELIVGDPGHVELTLNGTSISPFVLAHQGRVLVTHRGIQPLADGE